MKSKRKSLIKKKIAIITDIGFQKKEFDRFSIYELSKEFDIFIFDFTKITNPILNKIVKKKQIKLKNFFEVNNFKEFENFFLDNQFLTSIQSVSNYDLSLKINNFYKNNLMSTTFIQNSIGMEFKKNLFQKFYNAFFTLLDEKRLLGKIKHLSNKKKKTLSSSNVFVCGLQGLKHSSIGLKTKIIKSHSSEYDFHIRSKSKKIIRKSKDRYSVFLDQYLPFHTDAKLFKNFNNKVTKEKYFPALNNFFSFFEKYTKTKVIIATHPKANYKNTNKNFWYGRHFYKDKTYELIRNSSYVMGHTSHAISYAVILKKPMIFLTSNEYMKSYDNFRVHGYAKYFNQSLFNIDHFKKIDLKSNLKRIDKTIYKKYFNDYIKYPGSPKTEAYKILINHFKKIS